MLNKLYNKFLYQSFNRNFNRSNVTSNMSIKSLEEKIEKVEVDLTCIPENVPSLCIPRVFKNITETRVRSVIGQLDLGDIDRVDLVMKKTPNGEEFQRVFIHFRRWYKNENADKARRRLITGNEVKIVYDEPWFWKVSANRSNQVTVRPDYRPDYRRPDKYKVERVVERVVLEPVKSGVEYYKERRNKEKDKEKEKASSLVPRSPDGPPPALLIKSLGLSLGLSLENPDTCTAESQKTYISPTNTPKTPCVSPYSMAEIEKLEKKKLEKEKLEKVAVGEIEILVAPRRPKGYIRK